MVLDFWPLSVGYSGRRGGNYFEWGITASRTSRIFAYLIDHTILCCLGATAALFAMGNNWDRAGFEMIGKMWPVFVVVFALYFFKDSVYGMSPGRFVLGIAVRDGSAPGDIPSVLRLALRNLFIAIWPVEFLVLVFSKQKRRIGDLVAKTVVIKRIDLTIWHRLMVFLLLCLISAAFFAVSISALVQRSSAYKTAISYLAASPEVAARVGKVTGYGPFPTGNIQVQNQYGNARLSIKVKGDKGTATVQLIMEMKPEANWLIKETSF